MFTEPCLLSLLHTRKPQAQLLNEDFSIHYQFLGGMLGKVPPDVVVQLYMISQSISSSVLRPCMKASW